MKKTEFDFGLELEHFSHLFSNFATKNRQLIALICEQKSMTYGELEDRANQVSHYLVEMNVSPGAMIGVLYERKIEYVVLMLAVLKAGAVYVPLDPAYPIDRLKYMSENSELNLILTSKNSQAIAENIGKKYLVLNEGLTEFAEYSVQPLAVPISSSDLMYIVYTSGSTGRPKGVMIEHRSAVNLAYTHQRKCYSRACGDARSTCLWTPFSFDVSIEHIMTLMFGHTLHIVDYDTSRDPNRLLNYIDEHQLTILCVSPSYMVQLFDSGFESRAKSLELTVLGGETIGENLWNRICADERTFYNFYGPTETTIDAMCCIISSSLPHDTIGVPLDNINVYVLDESLQQCDVGSVGEIYIAGRGVARGYINNRELTSERFIINPFSSGEGNYIMYRTGDMAKRLADGNLQIAGRSDNQVKIRGYRIELNEIELALRSITGITDACVIAAPIGGDVKRIIAFVISNEKLKSFSSLKSKLEAILPDYMIPTKFIPVAQFPLTANGKVDKEALKALISSAGAHSTDSESISAPLEKIKKMWSDTFFEESIDPDTDFFDLGGDSFLVMRLVGALNKEFRVGLTTKDIYTLKTARNIASFINEKLRESETGV